MERQHSGSFAAILLAFIAVAPLSLPAFAQACKATDGSCGLDLNVPKMDWSTITLSPIQSIGDDLALTQDKPATIGAISFRGNGTVCVGLLRRGSCNK